MFELWIHPHTINQLQLSFWDTANPMMSPSRSLDPKIKETDWTDHKWHCDTACFCSIYGLNSIIKNWVSLCTRLAEDGMKKNVFHTLTSIVCFKKWHWGVTPHQASWFFTKFFPSPKMCSQLYRLLKEIWYPVSTSVQLHQVPVP
jgi:hypothetical protein